jgi:hypothetical protein
MQRHGHGETLCGTHETLIAARLLPDHRRMTVAWWHAVERGHPQQMPSWWAGRKTPGGVSCDGRHARGPVYCG